MQRSSKCLAEPHLLRPDGGKRGGSSATHDTLHAILQPGQYSFFRVRSLTAMYVCAVLFPHPRPTLICFPDISTAVPVCNALSLVFTAATAMWLGEKVHHPLRTLSGMVLVLVGLAVCVASKEKLLSR